MGRFRFAQLRKDWNLAAKAPYLVITKECYEGLKDYARTRNAETGQRRVEMLAYQAKNGTTQCFDF